MSEETAVRITVWVVGIDAALVILGAMGILSESIMNAAIALSFLVIGVVLGWKAAE